MGKKKQPPIYITKMIKKYLKSIKELVVYWQSLMDADIDKDRDKYALYMSVVCDVFGCSLSDCSWWKFDVLCKLLPNIKKLIILKPNLNMSRMNNLLILINSLSKIQN